MYMGMGVSPSSNSSDQRTLQLADMVWDTSLPSHSRFTRLITRLRGGLFLSAVRGRGVLSGRATDTEVRADAYGAEVITVK